MAGNNQKEQAKERQNKRRKTSPAQENLPMEAPRSSNFTRMMFPVGVFFSRWALLRWGPYPIWKSLAPPPKRGSAAHSLARARLPPLRGNVTKGTLVRIQDLTLPVRPSPTVSQNHLGGSAHGVGGQTATELRELLGKPIKVPRGALGTGSKGSFAFSAGDSQGTAGRQRQNGRKTPLAGKARDLTLPGEAPPPQSLQGLSRWAAGPDKGRGMSPPRAMPAREPEEPTREDQPRPTTTLLRRREAGNRNRGTRGRRIAHAGEEESGGKPPRTQRKRRRPRRERSHVP